MIVELSGLIGVSGLLAVIVGGYIVRDRQLVRLINNVDGKLHKCVNEVRKDVADTYVRRVDMDGDLQRIENSVSELRKELREERRDTNQRLDAVLQALGTPTKSS